MAGRLSATRLSVALEDGSCAEAPLKRARRSSDGPNSSLEASAPPASERDRPTVVEREAADLVIAAMRAVDKSPPILATNAGADNAVVACALALFFGQEFASDRVAKGSFGVNESSDVRGRWVNDKLVRLRKYDPAALNAAASVFKMEATEAVTRSIRATVAAESSSPPLIQPTRGPITICPSLQCELDDTTIKYIREQRYFRGLGGEFGPEQLPILVDELVGKRDTEQSDQQYELELAAEARDSAFDEAERERKRTAEAESAKQQAERDLVAAEDAKAALKWQLLKEESAHTVTTLKLRKWQSKNADLCETINELEERLSREQDQRQQLIDMLASAHESIARLSAAAVPSSPQ